MDTNLPEDISLDDMGQKSQPEKNTEENGGGEGRDVGENDIAGFWR